MRKIGRTLCLLFGLAGCNQDDGTFDVSELTEPASQEVTDIGERWLREILGTMQGETGQYLIAAAQEHDITVAYADDLQHRIGQFSPSANAVTLELPLGIETATEEQFQEMVLTGRRVMYEELDHGVRHHERDRPTGLSAQEAVDGLYTSNEAIARITTYIGMSEDAQIGSAPDFRTQLGMPESGYAIYYGTTDTEMADVMVSGLKEGEYFHERPDLINEAFGAFFDTSTSEWYTKNYALGVVSDKHIDGYTRNVALSTVLDDFREGADLSFGDLSRFANLIDDPNGVLLSELEERFESGEFTAEAEDISLNDLIRFRHRLSQPDGGRANHLNRASGGDFFRDAPPERLREAFDILINDAEVYRDFMASCMNKDYLSENARDVAQANYNGLGEYLPTLRDIVGNVNGMLSGQELGASSRIQLKELYQRLEEPLVTPSSNRVAIYNNYVRDRRSDGVRLCP